ncbi:MULTISPECIES: hypothetical protein [unclassified Devosia]|jgi:hypothetical protein|uniref:hypothetical protein n=2 Tax=Devosia TaxID=46913 RepID=UPI00086BAF63|nr:MULTISPECIES: hypothetical protein [unclassified Devosia]MBN9364897.1 hypothetical protein [Devosia sp.]ODS90234.1 MAG: hypothetical protein ABS47_08685 [Devosia sp. SCN 66-27]OJX25737.1 MAG: hypothetical protein BGO83_13065 [Devosia sp. 66-14]
MSPDMASTEQITFRHPFMLPGLDRPHPPGTFDLVTEREALDVSWPAFRLSMTILLTEAGAVEAVPVTRSELDAALRRDGEPQ